MDGTCLNMDSVVIEVELERYSVCSVNGDHMVVLEENSEVKYCDDYVNDGRLVTPELNLLGANKLLAASIKKIENM